VSEILEDADSNLMPRMRNRQPSLERVEGSRFRQIPGIGPLVATAIVAAIGNGSAFHKDVSSHPGLDLCRDSTRPAGRPGCSASASAVTDTCARSSCTAPDPPSCASSENDTRSAHGSMRVSNERQSTWSSRRQPTSYLASPGRFYRADKTIAQR
jgi:hypothetical protein